MRLRVNGKWYNDISYENGVITLKLIAPGLPTSTNPMTTTMDEIQIHYGRKTAYRVKQAFLSQGVDVGGNYAE